MEQITESLDEIPVAPQVLPPTIIAHPDFVAREIQERVDKAMDAMAQKLTIELLEQVDKVIAQKLTTGGNMSDSTVSKDWVERKASELNNKIEMEKVRSDARFDKLIADSNVKFEKLFGEIKASESTHTKWMVAIAFSLIMFTLGAIGFSTNLILRAIPSISSQSVPTAPSKDIPENPPPHQRTK